jgi:hypothetical protein
MLALARVADEAMTGRNGHMSTPAEHGYYAGRDHTFFAVESDVHRGDLRTLALPAQPPALRERLTGTRDISLAFVDLLPPTVVASALER